MTQIWIYVGAALAFAVAFLPLLHYFKFGLNERRREILSYFGDRSVEYYFKRFYQAEARELAPDPQKALADIYDQRFGIYTFLLPVLLYATSLVLVLWILGANILEEALGWPGPKLETRGVYALAGAYLWVTWDLISRYRQRDIVPSVPYWYAFRFAITLPLAYALSTFFNEAAAPPAAFALGAFPTNTLMLIIRRQGAQRFGLGNDTKDAKLELESLQGVNTTLAEKFSEIGVMTMLQLAYEDPIQLTMRTNLSFCFVTDVISQALATIYGLDLNQTRPFSLRGAIEACEIYEDLKSKDDDARSRALIVVKKLAEVLNRPEKVVERILHDIKADPYTKFLRDVWA